MSVVITCGGCGEHWTGQRVCHCGGCHETFSGISAFERHQNTAGCLDVGVLELYLVPIRKPWGTMWALPVREGADPDWWKRVKGADIDG